MKTNLQTLLAALSILFLMATASAQINPQTGLPEPAQPSVDPATGLPADGSPPFKDSSGNETWIIPGWTDPDRVRDVSFQGLPLSEVARYMREQFTNYFDVIFPNNFSSPGAIDPTTGLPGAQPAFDPTQISIDLQLNNVRASEIFSAMNLQFELNKSPLRWELTFNGQRPTAILRILPQLVPPAPPEPPAPSQPPHVRKVFYVGDILDDFPGDDAAAKLDSIETNILYCATGTGVVAHWGGKPKPGVKIAEYPPGQLLIVSGTPDEVDLVDQTLRALKEKAAYDKTHEQSPHVKSQ